jgi:hypothetical protein
MLCHIVAINVQLASGALIQIQFNSNNLCKVISQLVSLAYQQLRPTLER